MQFLKAPDVGVRLWQLFGFLMAFSCFTSGFAMFSERRLHRGGVPFGISEVGFLLGYVGLLGLVAQLALLRRLVAWVGEYRLVLAAFMVAAFAYAGLAFVHGLPLMILCLTCSGLANSLLRPSLLGLISQHVASSEQGAVNGLTQSLQSVAMILGPLIAGLLIDRGWLAGWALSCAFFLLMATLVTRLKETRKTHLRSHA